MAADAIDTTLADIEAWAGDIGLGIDSGDLRLLLELSRDHLAQRQPGVFARGDLAELLLDVFPEHVVLDSPGHAQDVIRATATLLDFAQYTDRLPRKDVDALNTELDEVGPKFLAASLTPEQAAELFAENERHEQMLAMLEELGLPTDEMAPMRLPSEAELADTARRSTLLAEARLLGEWAGDGRQIDDNGDPAAGEIAGAAAAVGIEVPGAPGLKDVPELALLLQLAEFVDFVDGEDGLARGRALADWPDGEDDSVLAVWSSGLAVTVGYSLDWLAEVLESEIAFEGLGASYWLMLFLSRSAGVPMDEFREMARATAPDPAGLDAWASAHGHPADILVGRLADLGAVTVDDEIVRLSPLGMAAWRDQLLEAGVDVPLLPPPAEMTAADLAEVVFTLSDEEMAAELAAWLEHRTERDAARDLVAAAAAGDSTQRVWVSKVVDGLGAAAEEAWREGLGCDLVRPYAKLGLAKLAGTVPAEFELDLTELASVTLDAVAVHAMSEDDLPESLAALLPPGREQELLDAMWRLPNPEVAELLHVIGRFHPDRKVAKHARKVAHKAATFRS